MCVSKEKRKYSHLMQLYTEKLKHHHHLLDYLDGLAVNIVGARKEVLSSIPGIIFIIPGIEYMILLLKIARHKSHSRRI